MSRPDNALDRAGARLRGWRLRARLGRAAISYAEHGWDVLPGARLRGDRFDCGRTSCRTEGCHPAVDDWESAAAHEPATVTSWWRDWPYAVLLATGRAFDVLEVPARLGGPAVAGLPADGIPGPIAVTPGGRWMFLVRPGCQLEPRLSARADVVLHGRGSWVPAPPTCQPNGPVTWRLPPQTVGFRVADPDLVQSLIVGNLPRWPRPPRGIPEQGRPVAAGSGQHPALTRTQSNAADGHFGRAARQQRQAAARAAVVRQALARQSTGERQ